MTPQTIPQEIYESPKQKFDRKLSEIKEKEYDLYIQHSKELIDMGQVSLAITYLTRASNIASMV